MSSIVVLAISISMLLILTIVNIILLLIIRIDQINLFELIKTNFKGNKNGTRKSGSED